MKKILLSGLLGIASLCAGATDLFFYSPEDGNGGLRLAVKNEDGSWRSIGNGYDFVKSDFGAWGHIRKCGIRSCFQLPQDGLVFSVPQIPAV